jgi:hypothetical protein
MSLAIGTTASADDVLPKQDPSAQPLAPGVPQIFSRIAETIQRLMQLRKPSSKSTKKKTKKHSLQSIESIKSDQSAKTAIQTSAPISMTSLYSAPTVVSPSSLGAEFAQKTLESGDQEKLAAWGLAANTVQRLLVAALLGLAVPEEYGFTASFFD